jgi:hypothetical protein
MDVGEIRLGVDWIHLAEDMDQWSVLVNKIMKLLIP